MTDETAENGEESDVISLIDELEFRRLSDELERSSARILGFEKRKPRSGEPHGRIGWLEQVDWRSFSDEIERKPLILGNGKSERELGLGFMDWGKRKREKVGVLY